MKKDKIKEIKKLMDGIPERSRNTAPFFWLLTIMECFLSLRTHCKRCRDFFHGKSKEIEDERHWYGSLSFYLSLKGQFGHSLMQLSCGCPVQGDRQRRKRDDLLRSIELLSEIIEAEIFDVFADGSVIQFFDSFRFFIRMIRLWRTPERKNTPFHFSFRFVNHCRSELERRLWEYERTLHRKYETGEEMDFLTNSLYDMRRSVEEVRNSTEQKLFMANQPRDPLVRDIWFTVVHADTYYISHRRGLVRFRDFFEGKKPECRFLYPLSEYINPRHDLIGLCYESIKEMLDKAKRFKEPKLAKALFSFNEDVMDFLDGVKQIVWGKDAKDPIALVGLREILLRFADSAESIAMGKGPNDEGWDGLLMSAFRQFTRFSEAVARVEKKIITEMDAEKDDGNALLKKVDAKSDSILTVVNQMNKRSQKKNEKHNLKIGLTNLKWIARRWLYEKSHPELYPDVKGRQISKADVFGRIPRLLEEHGVKSSRDLARAIANGRKQHPEWFASGNGGSVKKLSMG